MRNGISLREAITGTPLRFLGSPWPWRALAYLLTDLPGGVAVAGGDPHAEAESVDLLREPGSLARDRLRAAVGDGSACGQRPGHLLGGMDGLLLHLGSPSGGSPLVVLLTVVVVLGGLAGCAYLFTVVAAAQGALARGLLAAPPEERIIELTRSRARLADAFEAERRRIERDLHDGTQHQLTAVLMHLGLARLDVREDLERTAEAIGLAYDHTQAALDELRRVIRGIHPSALTDRGLRAAVIDLARHGPIPVILDLDLPRRPPAGVEAAAYFCISETLTNAIKHSKAQNITIKAKLSDRLLALDVRDDGIGGADAAKGSGLTGLADRIGVFEETLSLNSTPGGPTAIRVELPCG